MDGSLGQAKVMLSGDLNVAKAIDSIKLAFGPHREILITTLSK